MKDLFRRVNHLIANLEFSYLKHEYHNIIGGRFTGITPGETSERTYSPLGNNLPSDRYRQNLLNRATTMSEKTTNMMKLWKIKDNDADVCETEHLPVCRNLGQRAISNSNC